MVPLSLTALFTSLLLLSFSDQTLSKQFDMRAGNHLKRTAAAVPPMKLSARTPTNSTSSYRFYNSKTAPSLIQKLPKMDFDLGEIYSGLMPIDTKDSSRALFYVFQPKLDSSVSPNGYNSTTNSGPVDEITIWLNGGPGCSSLEGFLQENGRFKWDWGVYQPYLNEYSWANLTNMLWVEYPVGTGFSIGKVTATTEEEIAQDFLGFFKNFQDLYGIKNFKIYVTGESYAGRYVSYISAAMLDANSTTYYDLKGALMYDPTIGSDTYIQEEVPAVPHVLKNANIYNFNASFIEKIQGLHQSCGYADVISKYLKFPPAGIQPPAPSISSKCDVFDLIISAASTVNPCFNVYEITTTCPLLFDPLAFPGDLYYETPDFGTYFNLPAVKTAIHAPKMTWAECSGPVFVNNADNSIDPIQKVLPQIIDATKRVLVANGDYDYVLITDGALLAIQNMTWGGKLGFQRKPTKPVNIRLPDLQYQAVFANNGIAGEDGPQGIMGIQHYERGLMWMETYQSGHMQPQFQPRVAYRHLQWVLGHIDAL